MSITAISSLIAAIGGKAALPGLGEGASENGLPLDFAALLAEQIPSSSVTEPALLTAPPSSADPLPGTELLSEIIAQASTARNTNPLPVDDQEGTTGSRAEESAQGILAALSPTRSQALAAVTDPENKNKSQEAAADSEPVMTTPTVPDPGIAAQYILPLTTPPVQNRLQEGVDRSKSTTPGSISARSAEISSRGGRPAMQEQVPSVAIDATSTHPPASAPQAPPLAESRIIPRADTANAANLAGDSNPGNSGNTPAFATALAAAGAASGAPTAALSPQPPPAVAAALNESHWPHEFGSRIVWLAKNDQQVAQININPPQLGPVQISISLNGDQATATFASPHPEVRQAIQDSLPQLREMFSTAGISLGQANVGTQLPSQNREAAYQFANEARSSRENAILSPDSQSSSTPVGMPIQRGRGLVDLFA